MLPAFGSALLFVSGVEIGKRIDPIYEIAIKRENESTSAFIPSNSMHGVDVL